MTLRRLIEHPKIKVIYYNCDYFARISFDIAVILALLLLAFIYFQPFWLRVRNRLRKKA